MSDISSNNKRIARNTLFMYFRMFFILCVGLYTSRVILASLGFTDYGLYNVVGGVIAMFSFLNGAMANAISRYLTFQIGRNDFSQQQKVYAISVVIQIILAVIIVILGETIGLWLLHYEMTIPNDRMFAAEWVFQLSVLSTAFMIVNVPYNALVIAHEKMSVYAYISILDAILKLIIACLIKMSSSDRLILYSTILFVEQILILLIYRLYAKKKFLETRTKLIWEKSLFFKIFSFAGWSTIGNMFNIIYTQGVNIILNIFCGPAVNAARGIAIQVESVVRQFAGNVQTAINPQIIKAYASDDLQRTYSLIFASSRYCFYLLLLIVLPISLQIPYLLELWLGTYPAHTEMFVILTLSNAILDALINPMFTANLATGRIKIYHLCNSITATLFIPVTFLSLKYTGIPEIVFCCIILMNIIGVAVRMFIMKRQIGIGYHLYISKVILRILPVVFFSLMPLLFLKPYFHSGFLGLIETTLVSSFVILLFVFFIGITMAERKYVVGKFISVVCNTKNQLSNNHEELY